MSIQLRIASILDQQVFGGELYYIQHPDPDGKHVAQTYGVFAIVGGTSFQSLEGDTNLSRPRVQISIYSTNALELITKVAAVNAAMQAASALAGDMGLDLTALALFNSSVSVPVDGFEQETRRYYSHMDFNCWEDTNTVDDYTLLTSGSSPQAIAKGAAGKLYGITVVDGGTDDQGNPILYPNIEPLES